MTRRDLFDVIYPLTIVAGYGLAAWLLIVVWRLA